MAQQAGPGFAAYFGSVRSPRHPFGLPSLKWANLARVRSANILYRFTCEFIVDLDRAGKVWTLENPWTSMFWDLPYWTAVRKSLAPYMVELDYCMFGGARKKHTGIATNCEGVLALNVTCDGQHEHAPWTVQNKKIATAEEARYPFEFCRALATAVYDSLVQSHNLPIALDCVLETSNLVDLHLPLLLSTQQSSQCMGVGTSRRFWIIISNWCSVSVYCSRGNTFSCQKALAACDGQNKIKGVIRFASSS